LILEFGLLELLLLLLQVNFADMLFVILVRKKEKTKKRKGAFKAI